MTSEKSRSSNTFVKIIFAALFAFLVMFGAIYYFVLKPTGTMARDAGEKISNGISALFNVTPRVKIDNTVVIQESAPTLELAVVKQDVLDEFIYSNTEYWSTKELHLRGFYTAKGGFNLIKGPFTLNMISTEVNGEDAYQILVSLPEPELLSFEMNEYKILKDDPGWWNEITKEDRENAFRQMQEKARERVIQEGILDKSKLSIENQMRKMLMQMDLEIRIADIQFEWRNAETLLLPADSLD